MSCRGTWLDRSGRAHPARLRFRIQCARLLPSARGHRRRQRTNGRGVRRGWPSCPIGNWRCGLAPKCTRRGRADRLRPRRLIATLHHHSSPLQPTSTQMALKLLPAHLSRSPDRRRDRDTAEIPRRVIYCVAGQATLSAPGKTQTITDDQAFFSDGECTVRGDGEGAQPWRWELVAMSEARGEIRAKAIKSFDAGNYEIELDTSIKRFDAPRSGQLPARRRGAHAYSCRARRAVPAQGQSSS